MKQLRRYLFAGLLATAIHIGAATSLIEYVGLVPPAANAIAFLFATMVSYVVNTLWSFSARLGAGRVVRYVTVQVLGVALAAGVTAGVDALGAHYFVGILCIPAFVAPLTFTLHKYWTYRPSASGD